jgi:hypothetical protein
LFTQVLGGLQLVAWLVTVQELAHALLLMQAKGVQSMSAGVTHLPWPSHIEAGVCEAAAEQLAALQKLPLAVLAHAPPTHLPVMPQVLVWVVAMHLPWGSGELSGTSTQSPAVARRLHAMHASSHALSQHTPWAQKPEAHSLARLQLAPRGSRPQDAPVQTLPVTHCVETVQLV